MPQKILLAEDDAINRFLIEEQLKKLGYQPFSTADGLEAVRAFDSSRFAVVLMDIYMPNMGGIDAARHMRKLEAEQQRVRVPILGLTSDDDHSTDGLCHAAGMDDVLIKPVSTSTLSEALVKWLA